MPDANVSPSPGGSAQAGEFEPSWGSLYVWAVVAAGAMALGSSMLELSADPISYNWIILAGLTLFSGTATLRMSAIPVSFSIAETFTFAALLLFGPAAGTATVALDGLAISLRLAKRKLSARRVLFNSTAPTLAMWVAGHVLYALVDVPVLVHDRQRFVELLLPLALCGGIYFIVDTGLIAVAVAMEEKRSPLLVWRENFLQLWLSFFGGAYAAGVLIAYIGNLSVLALIAPLPLILYYALKTWLDRIDERVRHLGQLNQQAIALHEEEKLRRQAEVALRERDEQFRAVFDNALDALVVVDDERRYLDANPAACTMLGVRREELLSLRVDDFVESEFSRTLEHRWADLLADGEAKGEIRLMSRTGSLYQVEYSSKANVLPGRHLSIWRDVSERKRLEEQLRQAQKMESVGRLAGGIAHDFNNLLTAILGYGNLLLEQVSGPAREDLEEITRAAERAAALTRQLLAFSRKQVLQPVVIRLSTIVPGLEKMLGRLLGETVDVRTRLDPALWHVKVDPGQIEQVIINLAVNARDAMPNGGKLIIETGNVDVRDTDASRSQMPPGSYVLLEVTDTGQGMDEIVKAHLFEPFFTTKERGKGTGLGLATVYGIVKQSGGHILVDSLPGCGTSFRIYFPRVDEVAEQADMTPLPMPRRRGSETVLLVEDETSVRSLARSALERHGYTVLEAKNGAEACAVAEQHQGPIDLLLTDVVMPVMGGQELARRLTPVFPDMKVVFMSGYTDEKIVQRGAVGTGAVLFQKPFTAQALAQRVRDSLDLRRPVSAAAARCRSA